jgi:drug/metabolite transporter (DMT)-like permease
MAMEKNKRRLGFAQIILSGICFGFLGLFGKKAYERHITPGELLSLRYFISALITFALILFTKPKSLLKLSRFEVAISLLLGICGYALFSSFYFMALTGLSASLTVLLLYTYPVLVTLFSRIFLKEKMGTKGWVALIMVTMGLMGLVYGEWNISGARFLWFGFGSAFFYALYIILSRKYLAQVEALPSSFYVQLGAGVVLSLLFFRDNPARPFEILEQHGLMIVSMAILCSLMAMTLFLAGLQKVKSSEASILSMTEPISGVIIASVLLQEKLKLIQVAGGILILVGMALIALKKENES